MQTLPAPLVRRPIEVAEMVKYACNAWHATKITFANEIGAVAKAAGVDGRSVMNIRASTASSIYLPYYCAPGFARSAAPVCPRICAR